MGTPLWTPLVGLVAGRPEGPHGRHLEVEGLPACTPVAGGQHPAGARVALAVERITADPDERAVALVRVRGEGPDVLLQTVRQALPDLVPRRGAVQAAEHRGFRLARTIPAPWGLVGGRDQHRRGLAVPGRWQENEVVEIVAGESLLGPH